MTLQKRQALTIGTLALAVVLSAISSVYARHESRKQFVELQKLTGQRDKLEVEWSRLKIEQGAWSTHARVEELARKKMHMRMPSANEIEVIRE